MNDFVNAFTTIDCAVVEALIVGAMLVGFIVSECWRALDKLAAQRKGWTQHRARHPGPRMSVAIRTAYEQEKRS